MHAAPPVADLMRTLADPTRLAIYQRIIAQRETTVGALTQYAGVSQPAVSQHVKALQDARLIDGRREGRNMFYRADPQDSSRSPSGCTTTSASGKKASIAWTHISKK